MHIRKNVTKSLWKIIDGRSNKDKIAKIISDILEANVMQHLSRYFSDGPTNLIWLLTVQKSKVVNEVIRKIKFPIGFASNINNILTRKVILVGLNLTIGMPYQGLVIYNIYHFMIYTLFVGNILIKLK